MNPGFLDVDVDTIVLLVIALVTGLLLGYLAGRVFSRAAQRKRMLTEELKQNQQSSEVFHHDVTEHFVKTSELIKNLTASYAELHQHLADSASKLADAETASKIAEAGSVQLELILPEQGQQAQAPKDYAPGGGILEDGYGTVEELSDYTGEETGSSKSANLKAG